MTWSGIIRKLVNVRNLLKISCKIRKELLSKNNITAFYRHVNRKLNSAHQFAPIRDVNNSIITDNISKAQAFNSFFASVFNAKPSSSRSVTIDNYNTTHSSAEIDFSPKNVFRALKNAKRFFSAGSDSILSAVWANVADMVVFPVSVIFHYLTSMLCFPMTRKMLLLCHSF